jgi:hypothetical protein
MFTNELSQTCGLLDTTSQALTNGYQRVTTIVQRKPPSGFGGSMVADKATNGGRASYTREERKEMSKNAYIKNDCYNREDALHCNAYRWGRDGVACPCILREAEDIEDGEIFYYDPDTKELTTE